MPKDVGPVGTPPFHPGGIGQRIMKEGGQPGSASAIDAPYSGGEAMMRPIIATTRTLIPNATVQDQTWTFHYRTRVFARRRRHKVRQETIDSILVPVSLSQLISHTHGNNASAVGHENDLRPGTGLDANEGIYFSARELKHDFPFVGIAGDGHPYGKGPAAGEAERDPNPQTTQMMQFTEHSEVIMVNMGHQYVEPGTKFFLVYHEVPCMRQGDPGYYADHPRTLAALNDYRARKGLPRFANEQEAYYCTVTVFADPTVDRSPRQWFKTHPRTHRALARMFMPEYTFRKVFEQRMPGTAICQRIGFVLKGGKHRPRPLNGPHKGLPFVHPLMMRAHVSGTHETGRRTDTFDACIDARGTKRTFEFHLSIDPCEGATAVPTHHYHSFMADPRAIRLKDHWDVTVRGGVIGHGGGGGGSSVRSGAVGGGGPMRGMSAALRAKARAGPSHTGAPKRLSGVNFSDMTFKGALGTLLREQLAAA